MYDSDDSDMQTVTVLPDLPPPPTNTDKSLQPEIPGSVINVQKDTTKYIRQFVPIDEEEVDNFMANQENRGTLKKTTSDLRTLIQFLEKKNEKREIHNIPPKELNNLLSQFFISARKSDGENYEPATLKGQFCSFNRFLKRHDYGHDLTKSIEFCKTRDALTAKQVDLKKMGKGNGAGKADVLTDADIDALFSSGQLGLSNPTALLHTVWFCNTIYFGLRGVTEHYQMRWGDVKLCKDHKNNEYIQMNERNIKTRTGTDVKNKREIPQRAWANLNDQTRLYKSKRPVNFSKPEDPFYIQENTYLNKSTRWYKSQIVGVNKLGKFMKIMAEKSGIIKEVENMNENDDQDEGAERHLTNHSARRFVLQKLDDAGVEHNHVKQISGHRNIQSISSYSKLNPSKHKEIASCILGGCDDRIQASQTLVTIDNNVGERNVHQTTTTSERQISVGQGQAAPAGLNYIFGAPIYGGTFNINIQSVPDNKPQQRKRRRVILDSDSSQE